MDSASVQFVLFGLCVAATTNVRPSRVWRSSVLMLASLIFLGLLAGNFYVLLPLVAFLSLGYVAFLLLSRGWSKHLVWSVLMVIAVYAWLKQYPGLPKELYLQHPCFTLGLSYILFRVLHLLNEAKEGNETDGMGLGAYLLYTLNFTTLISGPIQRYEDFAHDQFAAKPIPLGADVVGLQLERIIRGFFKVNVLAMVLDLLRTDALNQLSQHSSLPLRIFSALQLAVLYPFFLYANFSGYIDIVIALGRLMRLRLPENFDRPFSASSFADFWNRWHISLSVWLKTYVFNPLLIALTRRFSSTSLQPYLGIFCFFVTFFVVGIWHGRTSAFAFFGVLQGGGVALNKLWQLRMNKQLGRKKYKTLATNPFYVAFARGLTFTWFAFTLFWFWSDWTEIDKIKDALGSGNWIVVWIAVWLAATVVLAAWEWLRARLMFIQTSEGPVFVSRYARVVYASALGLIALVVTVLLNQPAPPIVYKAF